MTSDHTSSTAEDRRSIYKDIAGVALVIFLVAVAIVAVLSLVGSPIIMRM